jgi:hypothetical protein
VRRLKRQGKQSLLTSAPTAARPSFELLCEQRELPVVNPATGARFTISLRDWQGALWAVQVRPAHPRATDAANPFVQKHRLMARSCVEGWLLGLRVESRRWGQAEPGGPKKEA